MICDSPQYLMDGGVVECGICSSCFKAVDNAARQRRLYWLNRRRYRDA